MAKIVGRPTAPVRRPVLQFRVREPVYKALKKSAKNNGRSISSEAEAILEIYLLPALLNLSDKDRASVFGGFQAICDDMKAGKPPSW